MTVLIRRDFNFSRKAEEDKEVLVGSSRKPILKGLTGYPIKMYPSPLEHKDFYPKLTLVQSPEDFSEYCKKPLKERLPTVREFKEAGEHL